MWEGELFLAWASKMQKNSKIDVRDKSPKSINSIYGIENREKARNRCMRDNGLHFTVFQQKKPEVWKGLLPFRYETLVAWLLYSGTHGVAIDVFFNK